MSSQNITPRSPLVSSLKQGSGTIWTPTPTRSRPSFLSSSSSSGFPSPLCEPLSPPPSGRSRSVRSRSSAFPLPGNPASISTGSKRARKPSLPRAKKAQVGHDLPGYFDDDDDDDDQDTWGLDGEVIPPRAKKARVGHVSPGSSGDAERTWVLDGEDILEDAEEFLEDEEEVLEEGKEILDEEEEGRVGATTTARLQAKQLAANQLGLADDLERGESWGSMFLARCTGEKGLKNDLVRFIEEQKSRSVGQSLVPIESSIQGWERKAWPTHCEEVDKHWNPFVDNVVQLAQGTLTPARHFSKPTGPRKARLYVVWHYPTYSVEVTEWGMISSRKNPSIGQQVRKIGLPQDVCTDDLIPIRSNDRTTDQDRHNMWPNFNLIKEACIRRIWDNLEHQRFAVLMGNDVVEAIGASVPKKYTRHIMYVNLRVNFLGSPQPFFWVLKDSGTHKIELVLFCCWHLATFQPRYKKSMELKMCADLLWNAICEFSGVSVADPTFFQDRGRPHNRHSSSSAASFSLRRQKFRTATAVEQDAILQSFKSSGETAEDYFGGWTVNQVVTMTGQRIKADSTPADTPATRFAGRRFEFRKMDAAAQEVHLKRITASGQTPEAYFGGQSLDKVRNPFSIDKNATPQALATRRFHFRKLSAAKQEELLQNIKDIDETPEAYFGKGFTVAMVRSKFDFGDVGNQTWKSRRLQFKNKTEAKRQKVLKEIQDAGKTPKDFFGGWTVEQVLSGRSPNELDFSNNHPGTQSTRRNAFRKHSTAKRQEILRSIQDAGKTPEDYFGEGYGVDEVLNGGR